MRGTCAATRTSSGARATGEVRAWGSEGSHLPVRVSFMNYKRAEDSRSRHPRSPEQEACRKQPPSLLPSSFGCDSGNRLVKEMEGLL